jgi:5-hydroxyisourate hydrolase / 2-oxo-4-hydroxy-4-carboxy-5-ureidoimidazoline decarboxylase
MTLHDFNKLENEAAAKLLMSCCGSANWVNLMMAKFPVATEKELVAAATGAWYDQCSATDWLEAFSHHPEIGDTKSLAEKFAGKEQESVAAAPAETIEALANANAAYKNKFGFIFIVCATGKPATEMLHLMQHRLKNTFADELHIAMGEQHKITLIRFKKILTNANFQFLKMSQLTTHVLDTSVGKPGKNMAVKLLQQVNDNWQAITQGITDNDGRIADLLPPERSLIAGNYKLVFETAAYFAANNIKGFYPEVEIQFTVFDEAHYHVPLLINPFGYTTYRGS